MAAGARQDSLLDFFSPLHFFRAPRHPRVPVVTRHRRMSLAEIRSFLPGQGVPRICRQTTEAAAARGSGSCYVSTRCSRSRRAGIYLVGVLATRNWLTAAGRRGGDECELVQVAVRPGFGIPASACRSPRPHITFHFFHFFSHQKRPEHTHHGTHIPYPDPRDSGPWGVLRMWPRYWVPYPSQIRMAPYRRLAGEADGGSARVVGSPQVLAVASGM